MNKYLHWTSLLLFFSGFAYFFLPTWSSFFERWNRFDESYSHGYLVLIIVIYLLFQQIQRIDYEKIKVNYLFVPVLMLCSFLWVLSYFADIEVIHQILIPIMLCLFFLIVLGVKEGQKFFFPALFLYCAIPFWDYLVELLQDVTVWINGVFLGFIGIPVYIEGVMVTIPEGVFEVAGGCSGLRYLIVALTLAALYAYQNYTQWRTRTALILTAVFFALLANWLRVYIIIIVGHVTNMQSDLINNHDFFGWILFAFTLIPFFYLAGRYSLWFKDEMPVEKTHEIKPSTYHFAPYLVACLALFIPPMSISSAVNDNTLAEALPVFSGDTEQQPKMWLRPVFIGADGRLDEVFKVNGERLQVSFRHYAQQHPGKELVYYKNHIYSNAWQVTQQSSEHGFAFKQILHSDSGKSILVASQYSIAGYKVDNRMAAKLLELFKPLMSSQHSSVLILATPCRKTCESAKDRINVFISDNKRTIMSL